MSSSKTETVRQLLTHSLSLCNDVVFKMLFATQLPLLTDLINAVRYPAAPITVQQVLNPAIPRADLRSVKCKVILSHKARRRAFEI